MVRVWQARVIAACARKRPRQARSLWRRPETCLEKHLAHGSRRNADAETLEFAFPPGVVIAFRRLARALGGGARVPEYALSGRHVDGQRTHDRRRFKRPGGGHGANETPPGARWRLAHSVTTSRMFQCLSIG